jgi:hypothetical protein
MHRAPCGLFSTSIDLNNIANLCLSRDTSKHITSGEDKDEPEVEGRFVETIDNYSALFSFPFVFVGRMYGNMCGN